MAGLGGADGNFGGLEITNLTHKHHVRVVAQDRTQPGGKGQADLFANLDLNGAFELVFDGVLEGDDLAAFIVGLRQRGVQGGCLAAAGGAGQQHHTLRQLRQLGQHGFLARFHAEMT